MSTSFYRYNSWGWLFKLSWNFTGKRKEHAKKDREYVFWKHQVMNCIVSGPVSEVKRIDKRTNKTYYSCRFYTKPVFSEYRTVFLS